jgi:nitrogen-specific signal transduction histidine kinase
MEISNPIKTNTNPLFLTLVNHLPFYSFTPFKTNEIRLRITWGMLNTILERDFYREIPEDDYMQRQRYILFVLFSIIACATGIILFFLLTYIYMMQGPMPYMMLVFSGITVINYFAFQKHRNKLFSYSTTVIAALALIHTFIYFTGGIQSPANFYLVVLAVTSFMLVGKRAGLAYFALCLVHLAWAYYATLHTSLISNYHKGHNGTMEADLIMSCIISVAVVSFHCMSLTKSSEVILKAMNATNNNLKLSLSKLERSTAELQKSNAELDKFAYVVSHDLKAPLRAIGNLSSWIEEDMGEEAPGNSNQNLNLIKGRVMRMEKLINGLLEYSRLGKTRENLEQVSLHKLISESIEFVNPGPDVAIELPAKLPVLRLDRIQMNHVFMNLISNAIKYNDKENKSVKIGFRELRDTWEFNVEDNGMGIETQYHEKVFVIFQTLQARDTYESTGVGLAIVKKIVDEAGGSIRIESNPGEGSNFIVSLPKEYGYNDKIASTALRMVG